MYDLDELMQLAEGSQLEAKAAQGGLPHSVWETYSAFANSDGGVILLGVKEQPNHSLTLVGLADPERMEKEFWDALNGGKVASPNILTDQDVKIEAAQGKRILVIQVPRAQPADKPVFLGDNPFTRTYRRNGEGDYRCAEEEVRGMIRDNSADSADKRPLESHTLDALCPDTVAAYRQTLATLRPAHPWASLPDADFLIRIDAAARHPESQSIRPTRAGLLMFGWEHEITREFPYYFLDYREVLSDRRWDDRVVTSDGEWSGNVFDFWRRVVPKLTSGVPRPFDMDGRLQRIDDTSMHRALREALANLLIHADYRGNMGSTVMLYDDRVILTNPGALLISRDVVMAGGMSKTRNPSLMKMFNLLQVGERAGSGFDVIRAGCRSMGLPQPELKESFAPDRTTLTVMLPTVTVTDPDGNSVTGYGTALLTFGQDADGSSALRALANHAVDENVASVARMVFERERISRQDVQAELKVSKATANNILRDLVEAGVIERKGAGPSTYYIRSR